MHDYDFDKEEEISFLFYILETVFFLPGSILLFSYKYYYWGFLGIALSWVVEFIRRMVVKKYCEK
ncbi:MAG: hypothetical protein IJ053_01570 [Lachnospiraceae bacterium]|nr:hypothetical protein [Lachnospiraceae bacterium]